MSGEKLSPIAADFFFLVGKTGQLLAVNKISST